MNSLEFIFDGDVVEASVERAGENFRVKSGDKEFLFRPEGENLFSCLVNGHKSLLAVVAHQGKYYIDYDSHQFELTDPSEDGFAGGGDAHGGDKDKIFAPMPGKIVKILVSVGDSVSIKQPMVVVEAMKMENQVNSRANGTVKAINFSDGDQVDTETPIIELEIAPEE
ncbi:MAG: hypothetical protein P1R58_09035 [bacterium]|nr:hypothetical protein [bacterium]